MLHIIHPFGCVAGFASRKCSASGWAEVNLIGCMSSRGRDLFFQVQLLEDKGQILTLPKLGGMIDSLREFVGDHGNISGGDVQVAGKLLSLLIGKLEDLSMLSAEEEISGEDLERSVHSMLLVADTLLSHDLSEQWREIFEEVGFDCGGFLLAMEHLSLLMTSDSAPSSHKQYVHSNILMQREPWRPTGPDGSHSTDLRLQQMIASSITMRSSDATHPLYMTVIFMPSMGFLLPERAEFDLKDMSVATPILSIQAINMQGSEITEVEVNITLEYTHVQTQADNVGMALCAAWNYHGM